MSLSFIEISGALLKMVVLILVGVFIAFKGWTPPKLADFATSFLVKVAVPCLIFSTFMKNSSFLWSVNVPFFVVASICFFAIGILNSCVIFLFKDFELKREFIMLLTFQNCGYLPMTLSFFLFPADVQGKFLVFIFVYILGFNVLMWSWGTLFLSRQKLKDVKLAMFLTPPLLGIVFSFIIVYTHLDRFIPQVLVNSASAIGSITFILSMLLLGVFLHQDAGGLKGQFKRFALLAAGIKLLIIPLEIFFILKLFDFSGLVKTFLVVQACMPSAASLPIVASWAKGNRGFMAQGVFLSNVLSLFTVPLWLMLEW